MSLYIDRKYINFISSHFEKFKWKGDNIASCRCKFCGDSSKNKNKTRGYFFARDNSYFYKCHNCGVSHNINGLLQIISPTLFKEYVLDNFKDEHSERTVKGKTAEVSSIKTNQVAELPLQPLSVLSPSHKAIKFVEGRGIPKNHWCNLAYAEDFKEVAENFSPAYKDRFFKEDRLIIQIKSPMGLCGLQGRSFSKMSKMKYITLKHENRVCYYNYDKVDLSKKFYVVEGPIDAMFLPNAIATLGLSKFKSVENDENAVYVLDNQPYNREVVNTMNELISSNKKVCIFPKSLKEKDINDMVLAKMNPVDIIDNNTYSGLQARLIFNQWKKI
jgi:hypothetical protein